MKAVYVFLAINLICFALLPTVVGNPDIENYRPETFEVGSEEEGSISIFKTVLWITVMLFVLKLVGIKIRHLIDFSAFSAGYLFGSLFGMGFPLGLVLLSYRKSDFIMLYNLSSIATIIAFSLIFAPFVTPDAALLLFALLGLYDVIGVLYLPVIQFLWLRFDKRFDAKTRKYTTGVAILTDDGLVGAGDFALPTIFALSFGSRGLLALPLLLLGFWLTHLFARKFRTFPGLPLQVFFGSLAYFILT
ncbi:MAG: hypothetical protein GOV00_02040 [Candidatus Altiarchaeota archaeon]|nr:hypothetical protein [Candidatus Altiarchaeota archaeon]